MSKPIRFSISGGKRTDTDAPTVEDLLAQVGDYFAILKSVEEAIAEDGAIEIEWRVTSASKSSPLALELTPFPRRHGMDIENRVMRVKKHTAEGLALLTTRPERPSYFTDTALERAEKLFKRVTDGLESTLIDFGDGEPRIAINRNDARAAASNVSATRKPKEKPYIEIGAVDGALQRVERDGYGRPLLFVKLRTTGEVVKCLVSGEAQKEIERHEIGDVWRNQRVRVFGAISYKSLGSISQIETDNVQFLRSRKELPSPNDIIDEGFTGGIRSEEYLERLRSGNLS